jgi:hypothetical protein
LKYQVNKKEESCHKLEDEVVYLRKKVEKSNKFLNTSMILNEIFESQRSPNDKLGLEYKREDTHDEENTSKKHEVSPPLSKDENNVASQPPTQGKESFKRTKQGRHQESIMLPQRRWTPKKRYHNTIRCWRCDQVGHIVIHCHNMRCYNCSGFGHKSQDCWNTRRKSMMRTSYSMSRRRNEVRKGDIFEKMES